MLADLLEGIVAMARKMAAAGAQRRHNALFGLNATLASCMYLVDVLLNSGIEYRDLPSQHPQDSSADAIITIVQVLLQILALVNLLALLGATFLFRSGLFGLLYTQFRPVLLALPLYIALTIVLGICRATLLASGTAPVDIWDANGYALLSCVHKLGALSYYFSSIYAVEQLRQPKFYSHDYWMRR